MHTCMPIHASATSAHLHLRHLAVDAARICSKLKKKTPGELEDKAAGVFTDYTLILLMTLLSLNISNNKGKKTALR